MPVVKVTTTHPEWPLARLTPGGEGVWGGWTFHINQDVDNPDFWVVYEGLPGPQTTRCSRENTLFITAEPPNIKNYVPGFLAQFGRVLSFRDDLQHARVIKSQPALPWLLGPGYDELRAAETWKTHELCVIVSNKQSSAEHRQRLRFARQLRQHFGERLHFYGRGSRAFADKWTVLSRYKYSLALENCSVPDYFTEKLTDCYLSLCFPIYAGCSNIHDYFAPQSMLCVDPLDLDGSVTAIEQLLAEPDHYESRLAELHKARELCLDTYNLFSMLPGHLVDRGGTRELLTLTPEPKAPQGFQRVGDHAPEDVFVVAYPKSGNNWLQNLLAALIFGIDPRRAPDQLIQDLIPDVHFRPFYPRYATPTYFKSHDLPRQDYRNVIYVVRDGRDVMVSYFHYLRALEPERQWDFDEMLHSERAIPWKWHDHVARWLDNPYGARMLVVKYEDLLSDTVLQLQRIVDFLGLESHPDLQTVARNSTLEALRAKEKRWGKVNPPGWPQDRDFFRRGQHGAYRDEMPAAAMQSFLAQASPMLQRLGYL